MGSRVLLASDGLRPGILLNILQCPEHLAQNGSAKIEKLDYGEGSENVSAKIEKLWFMEGKNEAHFNLQLFMFSYISRMIFWSLDVFDLYHYIWLAKEDIYLDDWFSWSSLWYVC